MDTQTEVIRIHFLSKLRDGTFYWSQDKRTPGKDLSVWLEALLTGRFQTEILWDQKLFEQFTKHNPSINFPINSIDDLFKAVDEMNQDLINEEKTFFDKITNKKPNTKTPHVSYKDYSKISEGIKGNGAPDAALSIQQWYQNRSGNLIRMGFGSGMLSTTVDVSLPHHLRQKIRDACGSEPRPGDPAPKSHRVWKKSSNECLPMGWLRLKVLD
jgi:CRISPR-associated protein Csm5